MNMPTIMVESDNEAGFIIINECDLTDKHKVYVEPNQKSDYEPKPAARKKSTGK